MSELILPLDAFVRSIGMDTATSHAFLIGAGASVSSGIPSAERCIWEWKRSIFLTNNPGLEDQFHELSLQTVRDKIQRWLDRQGQYSAARASEEYSFYIERCYPLKESRRRYFQQYVQSARPHSGYKLLCMLAEAGLVSSVWTTNFDGLTARAAADFSLTPVEIGIDSKDRLLRPPRQRELLCVALHGDYRYDALKNTSAELRTQETELCRTMIDHFRDTPLIVSGYSGRDQSLMAALHDVYSHQGAGSLFWCGYSDAEPPSHVASLLLAARQSGRTAYYVQALGFDDLLMRLALHCLQGEAGEQAKSFIGTSLPKPTEERAAFSLPDLPVTKVLKSNAFELTQCPIEVLQIDIDGWPEEGVWRWLEDLTAGKNVVAVPLRGKVIALGTLDGVKAAFEGRIRGTIDRVPLTDSELRFEDGAISRLLLRAICQSLASVHHLSSDGDSVLWDSSSSERDHSGCQIYKAAVLAWKFIADRKYIVIKPSVRLVDAKGDALAEENERLIKQRILGWQHNDKFNHEVDRWRKQLFQSIDRLEYPPDSGSTFRFAVRRAPTYASVAVGGTGRGVSLRDEQRKHIRYKGTQLAEPKLVFCSKSLRGQVRDVHPMRGLLNNRPYDFALTETGLMNQIRVGVVCPKAESKRLSAWLQQVHSRHAPGRTENDYLLEHPGFEAAYGLPVDIPRIEDASWAVLPEPDTSCTAYEVAVNLGRSIIQALVELKSTAAPHVSIVFIPTRLRRWSSYETEHELFDVHDFVKAYCVQHGIATQFLEQDTTEQSTLDCRVWWWLSLALYAKSLRTPWVLDSLDPEVAFVGLGFSLDRKAQRGRQVVMGCSHIYNSQGEGVQYRLTQIENPVIRGKNPFMSRDDARRVGETIRQLFFDAKMRLPKRVVIHKRTQFLKDEREGLMSGLDGVGSVDMLELVEDSTLRFVSSQIQQGGGFAEDRFPVERGTLLLLEKYRALLWVHGVARPLSLKYYKGKRRIPAPMMIKRHHGKSDLVLLAEEILALSKMNWNQFDLYSQMPATLQSSGQIARIGSLLKRFGPVSYDYRLFI